MQPYFERDGITIYHGDTLGTLQSLQGETVDTVIADPPYASGGLHIASKGAKPGDKYEFGGTTGHVSKEYPNFEGDNCDQWSWMLNMRAWLIEAHRLTKEGGHLYIFTDWRQVAATIEAAQMGLWHYRGLLVWDKGGFCRAPYAGLWRQSSEFVVWAAKGTPHTNGVTPVPGLHEELLISKDKEHPTQKPIGFLRRIVETATPPGGVVLDPFTGSGTTLRAALDVGRQAIGVELSAEYCEIAARRLSQMVLPLGAA